MTRHIFLINIYEFYMSSSYILYMRKIWKIFQKKIYQLKNSKFIKEKINFIYEARSQVGIYGKYINHVFMKKITYS